MASMARDKSKLSSGNRPDKVTALFHGGEAYDGWHAFNWKHNRFYLVNAALVMGMLRVSRTALDPYLERARTVILTETDWNRQYPAEYRASKTQLYPDKINLPKAFDKALALIVALEQFAAEKGMEVDVYRHLRILPAFYYVDDFTRENWDHLRREFEALSPWDIQGIATKAGAQSGDILSIWQALLPVRQPAEVLREMLSGACVTREVARSLVQLSDLMPGHFTRLGEVQFAGIGAGMAAGTGAASLRRRSAVCSEATTK